MSLASKNHTIKAKLAYKGAPFSGFARQPGLLTVQGNLEESLELLYRRPIETTCAGRTDAGVHARGQIVSFDITPEERECRSLESLERSLNALVDDHIAITEIVETLPGFSARFDAVAREYRYFIFQGQARPVFIEDFVWHVKKNLDIEAMREASLHLLGEHDFKSFCMASSAKNKPTCRNVNEIVLSSEVLLGEEVLSVRITGNAFLHSMVRTMVGTLVEIGKHKHQPFWVKEVLEARQRSAAGGTAPAKGLVLWDVFY